MDKSTLRADELRTDDPTAATREGSRPPISRDIGPTEPDPAATVAREPVSSIRDGASTEVEVRCTPRPDETVGAASCAPSGVETRYPDGDGGPEGLMDTRPPDDYPSDLGSTNPGGLIITREARPGSRIAAPAIPGYEIIDELGRGGMGVVYRARRAQLNRPCALKMILAGAHASIQVVERFLSEAQAIARLHHPHIVQIYAIGEVDGLPYVELEYLPGGSLDRQLDGTPWRANRVARLVEQLARGIAEAHAQGIVHRDLKPSNVLLAADGSPKIGDFGLAKMIGNESGLTRSEAIMGSPTYMSPEQAEGRTKDVGPAADIYALGVILYELLTGRPPFRGASILETLEQVKTIEPVPPSQLVPRLPRDIETIGLKCLQKEPGKRYGSALALAEDLRRFQAGEPIAARPIGKAERAWRWCRRNPVVSGLLAATAMAMMLGTGASTYFAVRATRGERMAILSAREAMDNAIRADREASRAREEKRLSDRSLYLAEIRLARQAWQEGLTDVVQQYLRNHVPARPDDPDWRGFEWYYLERLCQSELRTLHGHADLVNSVAVSPDGRLVASASDDNTVKLWDIADGREVRTLRGHTNWVQDIAFSPDGRVIASASNDRTVRLWDIADGRAVHTLRGHTAEVDGVSFSPDGHTLASASQDQTVRLWDADTGREAGILRGHAGVVNGVTFHPDSRTLASAGDDRTVKVWDLATGRVRHTLGGHPAWVSCVAYSPDGRTLAAASDRTIKLWDAAVGRELRTLHGHNEGITSVAFSPDGRTIVSASYDRTIKLWDPVSGQELRTFRGHANAVAAVSYSPDGRTIASGSFDQTVKVWESVANQEVLTLRGQASTTWGVSYSPDGHTIASAGEDRTIKLWDVENGSELRTLRGHSSRLWSVTFHPDGRTLASAGVDRTIKVWDAASGRELRTLRGHDGEVRKVSYSPDGRVIASASEDRTIKLWDADTGREIRTLRGHDQAVAGVSYSPDGRVVVSGSHDQTVKLWEAATGRELRTLRGHPAGVIAVAYSLDGHVIASAGQDRTIILWDATAGQPLRTLRGHADVVTDVAFSPDGRILGTASVDGTVKLWDTTTGQEVLTLRGASKPLRGLSYSPDGRTIISACHDGSVKVWDAATLTPERRVLREARGLVEFLFARARPATTTEVLARIREDPTITAEVRDRALGLAGPYGDNQVLHDAERLVNELYAAPMTRPEVREHLLASTSLGEPMRRQALGLAERIPENANAFDSASWDVVRSADADPAAYARALRQAEIACRLSPQNGAYRNTLGVAQYRAGRYREAVETLTHSERLNATAEDGSDPSDLAFLALAQFRLGQLEEARAMFARLREAMRKPNWADDEESRAFLHEAEAIEPDLVFPGDPFAR